jgi:N-acetylneuraminic acid mutarotase
MRSRSSAGQTSARCEPLERRVFLHGAGEAGTGLTAEYFDNKDLASLKLRRTDPAINFDWANGSPHASIAPDTFSARWTGSVEPAASGAYTFYATPDDGVRLWVDGRLLIDHFHVRGPTPVEYTAAVPLEAGRHHAIKLEYLENYGSASMRLAWSGPGTPRQIVPTARLYPVESDPPDSTPTPATLRIEAGGTSNFTDAAGNLWSSDRGFVGGTLSAPAYVVAGTVDDALYYTRRWGNFDYSLAAPSGTYRLNLHFAEPVHLVAGKRKFNVTAEGVQILSNFDIVAAGGPKTAVVRGFDVTIADGKLDLTFRGVVENAIVSAIELIPATQNPAPLSFPWSTAAPLPVARQEGASAVVGGTFYVIGGYYTPTVEATARVDAYNPATNTWVRKADMPEALTHSGQATDGNVVWLVGGFVGKHPGPSTNHVWRYDTVANRWSAGPSLPAPRAGGGLARVGRTLHYFGGYGAGTLYTAADQSSHFVLNLDGGATAKWTTAAPLPNPRNHMAGVEVGGKVYAVGGQHLEHEGTANQDDLHVYNPATNQWTELAPLPGGRGHIGGSTFVMNGRIVVAGGVADGPTPLKDVVAYDPAANVWVRLPPLPAPRQAGYAGVVGERIVFAGGETGRSISRGDVWVGVLANKWEAGPALPAPLAEVAAGVVGNKLYVVGEGSATTYAYDVTLGSWSTRAARPHAGDHHAAEVVNGKLYLFGGFGNGAEGKVQIFDPAANRWTLGRSMPFAAGSSNSAVINGTVYVAGGIVDFVAGVGGTTTNQAARYNPATNTWSAIAPMPRRTQHAASATDGKKLYVFGGRDGAGHPENGFATVQIYDPATNTWKSSDTPGSGIAPLPQARGGMGKAVYVNGEFYVMGGETHNGPGATANKVYSRVDVYNPLTNTWRVGPALPTARHGIFPVLLAGRIYVAAGGIKSGNSRSAVLEIFNAG